MVEILLTYLVEVRVTIERISAVTLRVAKMAESVRFYRDIVGLKVIYGGEDSYFSSLCTQSKKDAILNLEQGDPVANWGRLIFHVSDVDEFWSYLRDNKFNPEPPRDASWGERYFHMNDPDGHELSFARPI